MLSQMTKHAYQVTKHTVHKYQTHYTQLPMTLYQITKHNVSK